MVYAITIYDINDIVYAMDIYDINDIVYEIYDIKDILIWKITCILDSFCGNQI